MWYGVELRDIRAFLTLAEELHYGRTAERLEITPSRVSQLIRLLETRVGGRLFDRTSRSVRLTPLGEQLRAGLQPAYEQMRRAYADAHETATGVAGTVRIGMYSPINAGPHMAEIAKTFQACHPAASVQFIDTGFGRDHIDWLRKDDVDLLAMRLPLSARDTVIGPVLSREDRVVLVAKDNPLAAKGSVIYDDLADYVVTDSTVLPREFMDAFIPPRTPSGRLLRRAMTTSPLEALMRVAAGDIVHPTVASFLEHFPDPGVVAVPIRDLPPSETVLTWLASNHSARVAAFVQVAQEVLGDRYAAPATSAAGLAPALGD